MLCVGRVRHPGPTKKPYAKGVLARHVGIEVLNVGGWLTRGDSAMETDSGFLLVAATGLIPARSRNEGAKLRTKKTASIWCLACQAASHVGAAGVVLVSPKGALVSMPLLLLLNLNGIGQWAESCMGSCPHVLAGLPISLGCMGFKEVTRTRRKNLLSLSYFFQTVLCEAQGQAMASPSLLRWIFNVLPLKIPSLVLCVEQKGWVDLELAFASGHGPAHVKLVGTRRVREGIFWSFAPWPSPRRPIVGLMKTGGFNHISR